MMEAQVAHYVTGIKQQLERCGYDIAVIRSERWDSKVYPNHARFMDAKRVELVAVGTHITSCLEELADMSGSSNSDIEKVWAYGIKQLAIADVRAAAKMAKLFNKGNRSTAGRLRVAWARFRGSTSYFMDDGN